MGNKFLKCAENQALSLYLFIYMGITKEKPLKCKYFVNIALFLVVDEENSLFFLIYAIERFITGKEKFLTL